MQYVSPVASLVNSLVIKGLRLKMLRMAFMMTSIQNGTNVNNLHFKDFSFILFFF